MFCVCCLRFVDVRQLAMMLMMCPLGNVGQLSCHVPVCKLDHLNHQVYSILFFSASQKGCAYKLCNAVQLSCAARQSQAVQYRSAEPCNTAEPSSTILHGRAVIVSRSQLCELAEQTLCIENSACCRACCCSLSGQNSAKADPSSFLLVLLGRAILYQSLV